MRCIEDELPFEISDSWEWCCLSQLINVYSGKQILLKEIWFHKTQVIYIKAYYKEDVYITVAGTIERVGKIPKELDNSNLTKMKINLFFSILSQDWLIKNIHLSLFKTESKILLQKLDNQNSQFSALKNCYFLSHHYPNNVAS